MWMNIQSLWCCFWTKTLTIWLNELHRKGHNVEETAQDRQGNLSQLQIYGNQSGKHTPVKETWPKVCCAKKKPLFNKEQWNTLLFGGEEIWLFVLISVLKMRVCIDIWVWALRQRVWIHSCENGDSFLRGWSEVTKPALHLDWPIMKHRDNHVKAAGKGQGICIALVGSFNGPDAQCSAFERPPPNFPIKHFYTVQNITNSREMTFQFLGRGFDPSPPDKIPGFSWDFLTNRIITLIS